MARIEARPFGELLPEGAFLVRNLGGELDLETDEEIAPSAGFHWQPMTTEAQALSGLGSGWDFDLDGAGEGGDADFGTEDGFPRSQVQFVVEVVAFDPEIRVWGEADAEVEIAGGTLANAGAAAAGEAEPLAIADTGRDFDGIIFNLRRFAGSVAVLARAMLEQAGSLAGGAR